MKSRLFCNAHFLPRCHAFAADLKQFAARVLASEAGFHFATCLKRRILIISTSAGTGHVAAGAALAKAFALDERAGEIVHQDALHLTNKLFRDFYSKGYTP